MLKGSPERRYRNIEIYVTDATLSVPDPNTFGGPVQVRSVINSDWRDVPNRKASVPQQRGIGLADMLSAETSGRPHRASADGALHVLEQMTGILQSSEQGRRIAMTSPFSRPPLLTSGLPGNAFD